MECKVTAWEQRQVYIYSFLIVTNDEPRLVELVVMIDQKHKQLHGAKSRLKKLMVDQLVKKFLVFLCKRKDNYGVRFEVTVAMKKSDSF
jgi:hypothetical protein